MSRSYNFDRQLSIGNRHERELDEIFRCISHYQIFSANSVEQRRGLDRWFVAAKERFSVEYKTDSVAHRTGNGFIETISVDTSHKAGWVYTSQADYLAYWNIGDKLIYWIAFQQLRATLPQWQHYPSRMIRNDGYNTIGLLVPLCEFEAISEQVINL